MFENDNVEKEINNDLNSISVESTLDNVNESVEQNEEVNAAENGIETEEKQENIKRSSPFFTSLSKSIIDTAITFALSGVLLLIVGLILKYILGFYIVDTWGMLFIMFLIVSVFYPTFKDKIKVNR